MDGEIGVRRRRPERHERLGVRVHRPIEGEPKRGRSRPQFRNALGGHTVDRHALHERIRRFVAILGRRAVLDPSRRERVVVIVDRGVDQRRRLGSPVILLESDKTARGSRGVDSHPTVDVRIPVLAEKCVVLVMADVLLPDVFPNVAVLERGHQLLLGPLARYFDNEFGVREVVGIDPVAVAAKADPMTELEPNAVRLPRPPI